jgi:TolB-like protein
VFISYASEDRTAARALRDTLTAAGLDVWYDENELGGGDAWDQKIRRQIRDCEYFMPVISATTEARKEGYFRREWRLATDRSLDMADDVLFLIPVTIDGTSENGARVPDKFLTVQWLRLPGGQATPALHHLVRRILSGNHHALTRPPMAYNRPPATRATVPPSGQPPFGEPPPIIHAPGSAEDPHAGSPPPMPPMPTVPEKGGVLHGIKFIFEILWWALTAAWMLFKRLPKWGRVVVTVWLVLSMFSARSCSTGSGGSNNTRVTRERDPDGNPSRVETEKVLKNATETFAQAAREARKNGNTVDLARLGSEIAKSFAADAPELHPGPGGAPGKRLLLVPFSKLGTEEPAEKFGSAVFASLFGQLTLTHARDVGLFKGPAATSDANLIARAKQLGSAFVLVGHLTGEGDARALMVRLLATDDGSVKWAESYPVAGAEPSDVADKIADKADDLLPKREGPRAPKP